MTTDQTSNLTTSQTELTDAYRRLNRLHAELDLGRRVVLMSRPYRVMSAMMRTASAALIDAMSLHGHTSDVVPAAFVNMASHRALVMAAECEAQIARMRTEAATR